MRLSKTALGLLNNQYRSVLKKCFLINAGLFALAMPAKAAVTEITEAYLNALTPNVSWTLDPNGEMEIGSQKFNYMYTPSSYTNQHKEFTGNDLKFGGAIVEDSSAVEGLFIKDYISGYDVVSKDEPYCSYYGGGAVFYPLNDDTSDGISDSNFIGNYVVSTNETANVSDQEYAAYGGALVVRSDQMFLDISLMNKIDANFIGNYVSTQNVDARGGALAVLTNVGNVTGDFVGNYVDSSSAGLGGALYIDTVGEPSQSDAVASIERISGKFLDNHIGIAGQSAGGAIYVDRAEIGAIENTEFTHNHILGPGGNIDEPDRWGGGAIYVSENGAIQSIRGTSFNNNYSGYYGGAVFNRGVINNISNSSFDDNKLATDEYIARGDIALGGAIYNSGSIGSIAETTFSHNNNFNISNGWVNNAGGAIYNIGTIDSITGATFAENKVESSNDSGSTVGRFAQGGAIYNNATIGTISDSTFSDNIASTGYTTHTAFGGAIYNGTNGVINSISGIFSGNYSGYYGGAIANSGMIGEISGNFENNAAGLSLSGSAYGGVIYNEEGGELVVKNATFNANYAFSETGYAAGGGAIANGGWQAPGGKATVIDSSFTNNAATTLYSGSGSFGSLGGAVLNAGGTLNLIAQNSDIIFSGNVIDAEFEVDSNGKITGVTDGTPVALYNETNSGNWHGADAIVNMNAAANQKIVFDDAIDGEYIRESDGQIYRSIININQSGLSYNTMDTSGAVSSVDISEVSGAIVFNHTVDGNVINLYGGSLKLGENGVLAPITTAFNVYGGTLDLSGDDIHGKSLYNTTFNAALNYALDVNVDSQTADELTVQNVGLVGVVNVTDINFNRELVVGDEGTALVLVNIEHDSRLTVADNLAHQETVTAISGADGIAADMNWQDKVGAWTADSVDVTDITVVGSVEGKADSLHWAKTNEIRNKIYSETSDTLAELNKFDTDDEKNFNFDSSGDEYKVEDDLGTTSGNVNVNGVDDGQGNKSTVDLDGNQGFDIADGTSVTLNDVDLVNSGEEKSVTEVDEGGSFNVNDSNISGNIEINNNGDMNLDGENKIDVDITGNGKINVNGGETTFTDSTIDNGMDIDEGATVKLEGDNTLKGDVEGKGNLDNQGNTTLVDSTVGEGVSVNNDGTINLEGNSKINGPITGNGSTNINGYVAASDDISGKVNVNAGGTLDVANNAVNADDISFAEGSTFAVTVNGKDDYGTLTADKITVEDGAVLSATLGQGIVGVGEEATVQLLKANNKDFNNFADRFDNNMYKFEKDGKDGAYKISLVKTAEDVSKDAGGSETNQGAAAAWIDGSKFAEGSVAAAVADQLAALAQNDAKAFNEALTDLAPAEAPMVQENVVALTSRLHHHINQQLLNGTFGNRHQGKASGDALEDVSVWGDVYMGKTKLDKRGQFYGFDTDSKGLIIGADKKLTSDVKLGAGYMYDDSDIDGHNRKTDVNTNTIFGYGEYKPSEWFVNGVVSYGRSTYKEKKHVLGNSYKGKYHADTYGLQGLTGYEMATEHVDLTPQAGLRYNHIKRHGYVDGLGQNIGGKNLDILTAVAGVKISKDMYGLACKWIRPEAYLGITYDLKSNRDNAFVKLGNGASYAVHGKRLARFGIEAGAGLTAELTDRLSANINYLGAFRDDYKDHTGMIGLKYNF
ncbi:MAG: autotransporter domain-containing protein [Alphaproteobacteria bacterium]|nr:autotransporter domain-containing protein [Alphaproteobacteria bacterium]